MVWGTDPDSQYFVSITTTLQQPQRCFLGSLLQPWNKALETPGPSPIHQTPFSLYLQCWGLTEPFVTAALNNPSQKPQRPYAKGTRSGNNSVPSQGFITFRLTHRELQNDQRPEWRGREWDFLGLLRITQSHRVQLIFIRRCTVDEKAIEGDNDSITFLHPQ